MSHKKTIFIIGDSTAAEKLAEKRPESGWGEHLGGCLNEVYDVQNHAVNGRSSKSFLEEGLFITVNDRLQAGDYLLIQFGHNDQKSEDLLRFTEPFGDYQENLAYYVEAARKKGAKPIILSSISRRDFQENILNKETLGDYPKAALAIATKLDVPTIDIFSKTQILFGDLGEAESKKRFLHLASGEHGNYPDGVSDNTHLNVIGAREIASLIAKELEIIL